MQRLELASIEKAKQLLQNGTVNRVLGWQKGEFVYDVSPAVFYSEEQLKNFVYNGFCGANLSKYLIEESKKEGKILVFLKPCDTYSFNQLIKEHRIKRENVYVVGVECQGKFDIEKFAEKAKDLVREEVDLSELCIGLKCGGSDGYSGLTANPLVGRISDRIVSYGGSAILTEVPEMFGAEQLLMNKCESKEVFERYKDMIEAFKYFYTSQGFPVYENPSPGNKKGGITTLEEKSLGCVEKAGTTKIVDVLGYGETLNKTGVTALNAPGNDLIASTALAGAGCQIVLFTTGRGTPFSTFVPTMKISTNSRLASFKNNWIDFNAYTMDEDGLFDLLIKTVNGEYKCKSEDVREIAFYKTGVTL